MRNTWKGRPIQALAVMSQDQDGTFVRVPAELDGEWGPDLRLPVGDDWRENASFCGLALETAARSVGALKAVVATLPSLLFFGVKPNSPVTVLGGEGIEWLAREAPQSGLDLLQCWAEDGHPEKYHRRHADAILVLDAESMVWPALLMLEPCGTLSVIALGMNKRGTTRIFQKYESPAIDTMPVRLDWRGQTGLDFQKLRKGSSAGAARKIHRYFLDEVAKKVGNEFLLNDDLDPATMRFLPDPIFCMGEILDNLVKHENASPGLRLASGSVLEIVKLMESALIVALSAAAGRGERVDATPAWLRTGFCIQPAQLSYEGPGAKAFHELAEHMIRIMSPRGWSVSRMDGNTRRGVVVDPTEISVVVEEQELGGHAVLEAADTISDWLRSHAGLAPAAADDLVARLGSPD